MLVWILIIFSTVQKTTEESRLFRVRVRTRQSVHISCIFRKNLSKRHMCRERLWWLRKIALIGFKPANYQPYPRRHIKSNFSIRILKDLIEEAKPLFYN